VTEHFETSLGKGRGRAQRSLDLIEAMHAICEAVQPITGRGVGYKLFTAGLIRSTSRNDMQACTASSRKRASRAISRGSGS
jgi:hypothetical protein